MAPALTVALAHWQVIAQLVVGDSHAKAQNALGDYCQQAYQVPAVYSSYYS